MSRHSIQRLVHEASQTFRPSGRFAYHYARGKLGYDTIFHEVLRRGLLPDAILILDALHYFSHEQQRAVLARIRQALPPGGVFLTRVGDAGAGLTYRICNGVDRLVTYTRGHRLPRLYCRTLAVWVAELQRLGFVVETEPMSGRKPFANVMLVCRVPHGVKPAPVPAFETMRDPVLSTPT